MIIRESTIIRSGRVMQVEGMFDVAPASASRVEFDPHLPLSERPWNIGLIVGRSGSGKSTIAHELFGDNLITGFEWSATRCLLDDFPPDAAITDITGALSSVGFASPPEWLRPFHVLSVGQQCRVTVARAIVEAADPIVIDEFTSTIDRTVAQVGSFAIAKAIRRAGRKFVAVSCHHDVIDWLQPDWLYEPDGDRFLWRSVQRRPTIAVEIEATTLEAWEIFKRHHYLSAEHPKSARIFVAYHQDQPIACVSVNAAPLPAPRWRISRVVVLPEWQGAGVGIQLLTHVGGLYGGSERPVQIVTGHPGLIHGLNRSPHWSMSRAPSQNRSGMGRGGSARKKDSDLAWRMAKTGAHHRLTATFTLITCHRGPFAAGFTEKA